MSSSYTKPFVRITSAAGTCIAFILLTISSLVSYSQYSETIYDVEDGLTDNIVDDIASDENGFIWVFTSAGLHRFDGHRFKEYKVDLNGNQRSIPSKQRFMNDSRGRLWINGFLPALLIYNNELDRIEVVHEVRYHDYIDLADDGKGNILLTSLANTGYSPILQLKESPDYAYTAEELNVPEENYYIHRFADGTMICSGTNGLNKMKIVEGAPQFERIELLSAADSTIYQVDGALNFLCDDQSFYLVNRNEILRTSLFGNDSFTDSIIFVEPLKLDFPEIGLVPDQPLFSVISDNKGGLFLRNLSGIYWFNPEKNSAERIKAESYGKEDVIYWEFRRALFFDDHGILWAGTDHGLLKIVLEKKPFHTISPEPDNPRGLQTGKLNSVVKDSRGHLWIGTGTNGLFHSIPDSTGQFKTFTNYLADPENPSSIHSSRVNALFEDSQQRLWVGAEEIQWMDLNETPGVFHYPKATELGKQIGYGVNPVEIQEDPEGNILVACVGSPSWLIEPDGDESYSLFFDSAMNPVRWLPCIRYTSDNVGYMYSNCNFYEMTSGWVLYQGIFVPGVFSPAYPTHLETLVNFDSLDVIYADILVTEKEGKKELWLNLELAHNNLFRIDIESLKTGAGYNPKAVFEIGPRNIYDLFQDKMGTIWCTTRNGLIGINPATGKPSYYYKDDGLPTNELDVGYDIAEDGTIYLCSTNGLVYFHPDSIRDDPPPEVYITGLRQNYKNVQVDGQSILKRSILKTDQLQVKFNQNFLGFEFSAFEYRNSDRIRYKYRLEGVDEDWVRGDERHTVDYPDLKPGRYTFRVIAANGNGVWNMKGASLDIHILPPIWFRWWAIVLEGLILLTLLMTYIRYRERNLKQQALVLEQTVEDKTREILEQRKEVDEMKSRFYTNISHEFRTPLTLLIAPLEDLLKKKQEGEGINRKVSTIMLRNARRLQRLINQLLDISKLESGKMELQLVEANLSDFTRTVASSFLSLAESRGIRFSVNIERKAESSFFDADKVEKIIVNLLSNAFKFCGAGGTVSLGLEYGTSDEGENRALAILSVEDTGKGMEKEQLDRIFDRFYQVSDSDTREVEGSGIGLALTKELVELMNGKVEVESEPGLGTNFRITFPVSEDYFKEQGKEVKENGGSGNDDPGFFDAMDNQEWMKEENDADKGIREDKKTAADENNEGEVILVVEDNPDLRSYIVEQFRRQYGVVEAENGEEGMEKSIQHIPDLVITDLMMPVMGGMEFCRKLREHSATNHIPVIMLTAKADKESRLEGLEAAADDYIIKPFDSELLLARAKNLIRQRMELRKRFQQEWALASDEKLSASPQYRMMREIVKIIDEHIDDPDFNLGSMAASLNVSNSGLSRKIKAICGTTPHEMVRIMRLKRAASLFRSGERNVTQVMYQVGMRNPSHFSSSFRKYFGVNPSDYRNPPES
ncbi:MAG: ATP-binding protein [Bacteroidota bacterium]